MHEHEPFIPESEEVEAQARFENLFLQLNNGLLAELFNTDNQDTLDGAIKLKDFIDEIFQIRKEFDLIISNSQNDDCRRVPKNNIKKYRPLEF